MSLGSERLQLILVLSNSVSKGFFQEMQTTQQNLVKKTLFSASRERPTCDFYTGDNSAPIHSKRKSDFCTFQESIVGDKKVFLDPLKVPGWV